MKITEHLEFKSSEVAWNSMTLEEVEKKLQELYNYQLKMYERPYEVSKVPADRLGKLEYKPLENPIGASGNIVQHYAIYGTPAITDPTKMYILVPSVLDDKPLKWYQKLWHKIDLYIILLIIVGIILAATLIFGLWILAKN